MILILKNLKLTLKTYVTFLSGSIIHFSKTQGIDLYAQGIKFLIKLCVFKHFRADINIILTLEKSLQFLK
jgi:hypothetical protein